MSFSSDVKRELADIKIESRSSLFAECYGMLLFCAKFSVREIIFKTENRYCAERFEFLISDVISPDVFGGDELRLKSSKQRLYKICINPGYCKTIYETFGHTPKDIKLRINRANLGDESLYPAFLRGVFLCCGSVTDPKSGYHLELSVSHKTLAENLIHLINEIEVFSVKPRLVLRKGAYIVYLKGNNDICDFLAYIGAGNSVMAVIEASAYKEIINKLNRKQNSELANIKKKADASAKQCHAIKKIIRLKGIDYLGSDLKSVALLRLNNPDMSLKELGENLEPPISRSGVNHRLERIFKIADKL